MHLAPRLALWALAAIATSANVSATRLRAELRGPSDLEGADRVRLRPVSPLRVHEWGVWRIRRGDVDHLADLERELPAFVVRPNGQPPTFLPEPPSEELFIADKPVVFFYSPTTMNVTYTVGFAGGEPMFHFPQAVRGEIPSSRLAVLRFSGQVEPRGTATPEPLAPVAAGHFWHALRSVGADFVRTDLARTGTINAREAFFFYDGRVRFDSPVRNVGNGHDVARARFSWPGSAVASVWVTDGSTCKRVTRSGRAQSACTLAQARLELRRALVSSGLSAAETESLLITWDHDLFDAGPARAIYLLPRASYDAMLPVTIDPAPRELVRTGVVISILD
jgi:hypothetical protein